MKKKIHANSNQKSENVSCRDRSFPNVEVQGISISQSIDAPITTRDTVSMSGSLSSQNGNAQGIQFEFVNCIQMS